MKTFDMQSVKYTVRSIRGFSLPDALQLWKTKYQSFYQFKRAVITHPGLVAFGEFVEQQWEDIVPLSVKQALRYKPGISRIQQGIIREVMLDCLGTATLFKELKPELINSQTLRKVQKKWDATGFLINSVYPDTYELYQLDMKPLYNGLPGYTNPIPLFAVRCWGLRSKKEHWLCVPVVAALGGAWMSPQKHRPDAIRAIAWTFQLDITNPKRIFRQGNVIIAEESAQSKPCKPYHLSKKDYLRLLYAEA